jgi:hypothetical protein
MRHYLFEKAKYFVDEDKIEILSETEYSIRLKVGKEEVLFKYQKHKLVWLCSCKSWGIGNMICSHTIAGLTYLTENIK